MSLLDEFKTELDLLSVQYQEKEDVESCIADADVIYMEPVVQADYTVSRDEGSKDKGLTPPAYRVTRELLKSKAKSDAIILHSLPRMDELPADVDSTRHARYWLRPSTASSCVWRCSRSSSARSSRRSCRLIFVAGTSSLSRISPRTSSTRS